MAEVIPSTEDFSVTPTQEQPIQDGPEIVAYTLTIVPTVATSGITYAANAKADYYRRMKDGTKPLKTRNTVELPCSNPAKDSPEEALMKGVKLLMQAFIAAKGR